MSPALWNAWFEVVTDPEDVARFSAALGDLGSIPPTYPTRWLGRPEIRAAIKEALSAHVGTVYGLVVQLGQQVRYHCPLQLGCTYRLEIGLEAADGSKAFALVASFSDVHGGVGEMRSHIALFARGNMP